MGLALSVFSGHAWAATSCNTGPAPAAPLSGTVVGGVVVNGGDFCVIAGANVSGGVRVKEGGILILCASTINGGVQANGAAELLIGPEEIECGGNFINGGVKISNTGPGVFMPAPSIGLENNRISGSVHLSGNSGVIVVASNTIAGGLFCSNNLFELEDEGLPSIITGAVRCNFTD